MSELKAGPELDRLVAEKVMEMVPCNKWDVFRLEPVAYIQRCEHEKNSCYPAQMLPAFSDQPFWALQVVEKMRERDYFPRLWAAQMWNVEFWKSEEFAGGDSGDSLLESICIGALKAVESLEVKA